MPTLISRQPTNYWKFGGRITSMNGQRKPLKQLRSFLKREISPFREQNPPILTQTKTPKKIKSEIKVEKGDSGFKPVEVNNLKKWINFAAYGSIVLTILSSFQPFISLRSTLFSLLFNNVSALIPASWLIAIMVTLLLVTIQCFILFVAIKAWERYSKF